MTFSCLTPRATTEVFGVVDGFTGGFALAHPAKHNAIAAQTARVTSILFLFMISPFGKKGD
jgi:hypothetical protein